jgi:hypothetical protein
VYAQHQRVKLRTWSIIQKSMCCVAGAERARRVLKPHSSVVAHLIYTSVSKVVKRLKSLKVAAACRLHGQTRTLDYAVTAFLPAADPRLAAALSFSHFPH